ncbi:methyl-accepting chemotaxis protein [Caproiciproducens faecalis]|uniref:MCP four helix bundle domain-containing protein n=1 Tax=Caproiciproducens faecalis TaxID=2820301 RepID=A0ABS7DMR0_9FIRM|nr:methyl-accepting chemotaxis protein [Caproiciproducens faecalis]MBW7572391.1 MCP four helix bundle domain-containing protein [Caproiciproducens faecalis]
MFKNMKIGKKLILSFVLVAIISSIGGVVGLIVMTNMNSSYGNALTNYGFSQGDIGNFNAEFATSRSNTKDILIYTDEKNMQETSDSIDQSNVKLSQYLETIKKTMVSQKEMDYYNTIKDEYLQYVEVQAEVIALGKNNKKAEAQELLESEAAPHSDKVKAAVNSLINEKTTTGNQLSASLSSQGKAANISILILILVVFILSFITAQTISRSISKPIREMADAAKRMSEGDLNVQIHVRSKDEIGQLGEAFAKSTASIRAYIAEITKNLGKVANGDLTVVTTDLDYVGDYEDLKNSYFVIVESLNDTLGQINQASQQVLSGSEQVSNGAQALAQGATEQASSIGELSASITEISSHIKDNAKHAANANLNVNDVRSEIESSNKHMGDMVTAMSQINDSSSEIGKIIKTIEDIAFQTNILALNAAVEAARAGTAGKGFAVVADEVRNLASKSAEAAKNTTSLIENSMRQVQNGTKIADETAKALLQVVESVKVVSDSVEQISQASSQQADSISQVTLGVDQISNVVQTNSATAEESAAASEELSGQAQVMQELVGKFKLRSQTTQDQNVPSEPQQSQPIEIHSDNSKY